MRNRKALSNFLLLIPLQLGQRTKEVTIITEIRQGFTGDPVIVPIEAMDIPAGLSQAVIITELSFTLVGEVRTIIQIPTAAAESRRRDALTGVGWLGGSW